MLQLYKESVIFYLALAVGQLGPSHAFIPKYAKLQTHVYSRHDISEAISARSSLSSLDASSKDDSSTSSEMWSIDGNNKTNDDAWYEWSDENGIIAPKINVRPTRPEERGKGGVHAAASIPALDVIARIPKHLVVSTAGAPARAIKAAARAAECTWAAELTAAAIVALHPDVDDDDNDGGRREWVKSWDAGGWATDNFDLGPPEADWGAKCVTGSLLATGSDNDHNIYAKFRFPCHPVVHRAGLGLALLTGCKEGESLEALQCRGRAYRSMRDALSPLVMTPTGHRKGSVRERRAWDVADVLSRVLARATSTDDGYAVVPLHDRLAHCDERGENAKLVSLDDDILLVAVRDISPGEAITRDYFLAPQLENDISDGPLRLLLQFGLPPNISIDPSE